MPLYEYQSDQPDTPGQSCRMCSKVFELRRPIERPALTHCPLCRNPVHRVISRINTPKVTKPLSVSDAKAAGFTIYEKRDKGTYEKL